MPTCSSCNTDVNQKTADGLCGKCQAEVDAAISGVKVTAAANLEKLQDALMGSKE